MEEEDEWPSHNIQQEDVKRYKGSSISTSQKTSESSCDWISQLPDSLLLQILSYLKIEEAIRTSLLSRRWRYLWTSISCLDFRSMESGKIETTTFIDNCVFYHEASKVSELRIIIEYEKKHTQLVDSWIRFAVRCEVEFLELDFLGQIIPEEQSPDYTFYQMPRYLFECGSVEDLMLRGCDLNLPTTMHLSSLKVLSLQQVDLYPDAIEHITSNCPVLEYLGLEDCSKLTDLNIFITNEHLEKLEIIEYGAFDYASSTIKIHAPHLISLEFCRCLVRTNYHLTNLKSLEIASFNVGIDDEDYQEVLYDEYTGYDFTELLQDLCHVKELGLSSWCIQAFSAKEIRRLDRVSINAPCVELCVGLTKWELPGIAYFLQSACNLETLEILISDSRIYPLEDEFVEEFDFDENEYWKQRELDLSSILLNTKTIGIRGFQRRCTIWDDLNLLPCFRTKKEDLEQFLENEMEFVRFLLKNSKVLKKMVIEMNKETKRDAELMLLLTQTLTGFPRASPNARLYIN